MRSRLSEQATRVNAAIALLRERRRAGVVVQSMLRRFRMSKRQAYRYVRRAEEAKRPMELPEEKIVFTVKLPKSLAKRIRTFADCSGRTLSAVVAQALEMCLRSRRRHGQRRPSETG